MSTWRGDRWNRGGLRMRGAVVLTGVALGCAVSASPALAGTAVLSIVAGTGASGASTPGPATSSALSSPEGVALDAAGDFYFADAGNHEVDKVTPSGILSVIAGTGNPPNSFGSPTPSGPATSTALDIPIGVAVDSSGNVYFSDNQEKEVFKVTPSGNLSVVAGNGSNAAPTPGPATSSALGNPDGVAVDAAGNLYIADNGALQIEKVTPSGTLSIVAGSGTYGAPTPGPATSSQLKDPIGVGVDAAGNIYIADTGSHEVEKVTPSGTLSIVAGTGTSGVPIPGAATSSPLKSPSALGLDAAGNLYITDSGNHDVDQVTPSGVLSVVAGNGSSGAPTPGTPTSSPLGSVFGLGVTPAGALYIGDQSNDEVERVGPPPAAPTETSPPTVSGTPALGQTLTVAHGVWTGSPTSYTDQWQDCDSAGANCTNIAGATGLSYTLTSTDVGHVIEVIETATNAGGPTSQSSSATAVVAAATTSSTSPTTPAAPVVCAATSVSLTGLGFGPIRLGMTRSQAHRALLTYKRTHRRSAVSCLAGKAAKFRLGYPSTRLLTKFTARLRARLRGRVMLVMTSDRRYALDQIKPGTRTAAARRRLAHLQHFKIGRTTWYVIRSAHATGVIKVQHGTVQAIGIANRSLTKTRVTQRRLLARV